MDEKFSQTLKWWLGQFGGIIVSENPSRTLSQFSCEVETGEITVWLHGMRPNSWYFTGDFLPTTLRIELGGNRSYHYDSFAIQEHHGTLWQSCSCQSEFCAVLSPTELLSPLNTLSLGQIRTFLFFLSRVFSSKKEVFRLWTHHMGLDATGSLQYKKKHFVRGWSKLSEKEKNVQRLLHEAIEDSQFFRLARENEKARKGPIVVVDRAVARASMNNSSIEIQTFLFRVSHPKASVAHDEMVVDVVSLESSAFLVPKSFVLIRVESDRNVGLGDVEGLMAIREGTLYCCSMTGDSVELGAMKDLLNKIETHLRTGQNGPYR